MRQEVRIDIDIAAGALESLMDALANGEMTSIVLTRDGKPAARLVSTESPTRAPFKLGLLEGRFPSMSQEAFDADNEEIARLFHGDDDEEPR